jgi:hypothetical protein
MYIQEDRVRSFYTRETGRKQKYTPKRQARKPYKAAARVSNSILNGLRVALNISELKFIYLHDSNKIDHGDRMNHPANIPLCRRGKFSTSLARQ